MGEAWGKAVSGEWTLVNETAAPPKVVTVYRTSKTNKYWKATT
jgi:hypothetical protein